MIYTEEKLKKRNYELLFEEQKLLKECNSKISSLLGNHRDENNVFFKKLTEFENLKMSRKSLEEIIKIKMDLYVNQDIKL